MSLEAWGDEGSGMDATEADALIEAGWIDPDTAEQIKGCVRDLFAEPMYENGKLTDGISVRFLMRMALLRDAAGLTDRNDKIQMGMLAEAIAALKSGRE